MSNMKRGISLFPCLSKKQEKNINPRIESILITYSDGQESFELRSDAEDDAGKETICIIDDLGRWTPEKYGFKCAGVLCLDNVGSLFGEDGIVSQDAKLGVGIQWKSKSSNYRGAKDIGLLSSEDNNLVLDFDIAFEAASLRNSVELSFVIYLAEPGEKESSIATGTIMGEIKELLLILEGSGSTFTVFEKNVPGDPLWSIDCDWDDPEYSQFSECVRVTINIGHNAWQLASDDDVRRELLKEIMASSMQIIISELEPYQYETDGDFEPGSVSAAVRYFVSRADINTDSYASVAKSVRAYLDKVMK